MAYEYRINRLCLCSCLTHRKASAYAQSFPRSTFQSLRSDWRCEGRLLDGNQHQCATGKFRCVDLGKISEGGAAQRAPVRECTATNKPASQFHQKQFSLPNYMKKANERSKLVRSWPNDALPPPVSVHVSLCVTRFPHAKPNASTSGSIGWLVDGHFLLYLLKHCDKAVGEARALA